MNMNLKKLSLGLGAAALLSLAACSDSDTGTDPEPDPLPPDVVTGAGSIDTLYLTKKSLTDSTTLLLNSKVVTTETAKINDITVTVAVNGTDISTELPAEYLSQVSYWTNKPAFPVTSVDMSTAYEINLGLICVAAPEPSLAINVTVKADFSEGEPNYAQKSAQLTVNCPSKAVIVNPLIKDTVIVGGTSNDLGSFVDLDPDTAVVYKTATYAAAIDQIDLVYGAYKAENGDKIYSGIGAMDLADPVGTAFVGATKSSTFRAFKVPEMMAQAYDAIASFTNLGELDVLAQGLLQDPTKSIVDLVADDNYFVDAESIDATAEKLAFVVKTTEGMTRFVLVAAKDATTTITIVNVQPTDE
jgi:hypothetical protein